MNRCRRVQEDMELWLDGDLDEDASRVVESHLLQCPSCQGWLAMRQELGARLRALGPLEKRGDVGKCSSPRRMHRNGMARVAVLLMGVLTLWGLWWGVRGERNEEFSVVQAEVTVMDDVHPQQDTFLTGNSNGRSFQVHCQVIWRVDGLKQGGTDD